MITCFGADHCILCASCRGSVGHRIFMAVRFHILLGLFTCSHESRSCLYGVNDGSACSSCRCISTPGSSAWSLCFVCAVQKLHLAGAIHEWFLGPMFVTVDSAHLVDYCPMQLGAELLKIYFPPSNLCSSYVLCMIAQGGIPHFRSNRGGKTGHGWPAYTDRQRLQILANGQTAFGAAGSLKTAHTHSPCCTSYSVD